MTICIIKGIQLPAFDVELLSSGELIAVPFKQYQREGETVWLYPCDHLPDNLTLVEYYQPKYLAKAEKSIAVNRTHPLQIKTWASCDFHWHITAEKKHFLPKVAESTVWNLTALEQIFEQYNILKLLFLRVYNLSKPGIVNVQPKPGNFFFPKAEDTMRMGSESDLPIVSPESFDRRKSLLLSGQIYAPSELERLQGQLEAMSRDNPTAEQLNSEIKQFLGWTSEPTKRKFYTNLDWVNTITALGNRSKEVDTGKSNYQAGTDFENIVRDSLEFLGFTVDFAHKGGAGGLDIFCSKPYPLVVECKAGKKMPNNTVVQLLNLGTLRLENQETLKKATKLIIGPGEPTPQLNNAARVHSMAIINPATLEKLVKIYSQYPGSVDLFQLKDCLIAGRSDEEVERYIQQRQQEIGLRSHLVEIVKKYQQNTCSESAGVEGLHGFYASSSPAQFLTPQQLQEILIELSSPLTGYLGRIKGTNGEGDRFYFLRDLLLDKS